MSQTSSREEILERIARVAGNYVGNTCETAYRQEDIYMPVDPDMLKCFRQEIEAVKGQCVICDDEADMYGKLSVLLKTKGLSALFTRDRSIAGKLTAYGIPVETDEDVLTEMIAGITPCECLVARTGSVVVTSSGNSGRQMHVFPPIHIVLASKEQLVAYPEDALVAIQHKYKSNMPSAVTLITGPSRTADIEKTLVLGAHGPKELIIFVQQN